MVNPYASVLFPSDTSGCSFYRMFAPYLTIQSIMDGKDINLSVSKRFIVDTDYFKNLNMIMLQRQVSDPQETYFNQFLVPLSKTHGMWLVYNIDDVIHMDDLPKYNKAWESYQSEKLCENIRSMLNASDFILTTTEYIKEYYHRKFEVPLENIIVIPNYLPHWWIGQYYNLGDTMSRLNDNRKKPRVGIISSSTHYDVKNMNGGVDDITHIVPLIRATTKKYQWVFFGTVPPSITDLVENGEVEINNGCDIYTYPYALKRQNLNAIVAPLMDNEFNRCKSNIKLLEAWAMGIPIIAQNIITYSPYTNMLFDEGADLEKKLDKLFSNPQKYRKMVKENRERIERGDKFSPRGWWLEQNLEPWAELFKLRSKSLDIDIEKFIDNMNRIGGVTSNDNIEIIT